MPEKVDVCKPSKTVIITFSRRRKLDDLTPLFPNGEVIPFATKVEIARRNGYHLEEHTIITKDEYILTLYRISPDHIQLRSRREPVLLQHGIGGTAVIWLLQSYNSIAFVLSRNGYDVWLSTIRGGTYSDRHKKLTVLDTEYWDFSFHEMAFLDLPAITEYISRRTNYREKIIYIGHSMGTTIAHLYSNSMNEHASAHLKGIILLSPIIYSQNIKGVTPLLVPFTGLVESVLKSLGIYALGYQPVLNRFTSTFCGTYPGIILCELSVILSSGLALEEARPDLLPLFFDYFPRAVSVKTLVHFAQCITVGRLRMYDYGNDNILKYNASDPPFYENNINRIPTHFFVGTKDFLATEEDVNIAYDMLVSREVPTSIQFVNFAHSDFFYGRNFDDFYGKLLKLMNKISET
ncbi:lipase member J-like [Leptinotarsa decemlineata]|uniref:lipase member J-like n=1 Tax=Leptinotarsa decemlineata TaxID=7539 RepID=UPI003D307439